MPSSGYTAITFVANEQPTTAKWNLIGSNDSSFNLGTGLEDGVLIARHFANNAVPGNAIAANAIYLGRTQIQATVNLNTSYADLISVTVTVPAGSRGVWLVMGAPQMQGSAGTERAELRFMEGSTIFQRYYTGFKNPGIGATLHCFIPAVTAGSHTYKFNGKMDIGTVGLIHADATGSNFELQAFVV